MTTVDDNCRLKGGIRETNGKWYVVISLWTNANATGRPFEEFIGPKEGLAMKAEALIMYYEKIAPITEQLIADATADGVTIENMLKTVLH